MYRKILLFSALIYTQLVYSQDFTNQGGDLSTDIPDRHAIQLPAPNVKLEDRRIRQLTGFAEFHKVFTAKQGLGPSFINQSCAGCHVDNGKGPLKFSKSSLRGSTVVVKIAKRGTKRDGSLKLFKGIGSQLHDHTLTESGRYNLRIRWRSFSGMYADGTPYTLRKPKVVFDIPEITEKRLRISVRMTPPMIGMGLIDSITDSAITERSDPFDLDKNGISGRPNYVEDLSTNNKTLGKFGFKAIHPNLMQQSVAALFLDMGITSSLLNSTNTILPEFSNDSLNSLLFYLSLAGVPKATNQKDFLVLEGYKTFINLGCDSCHRTSFVTKNNDIPELNNQTIHPFSDFLLHDMGKGLSDDIIQFSAEGSEWRTTPLWGLGFTTKLAKNPRYLHDGRAETIEEAILWHDGEGKEAKDKFVSTSLEQRNNLIKFLLSL
jgi:CxxC motif-containing protein (DUF1111 family)